MREDDRHVTAEAAALAAVAERVGGDLGLAEEPSHFVLVLEDGAEPEPV
ncbi:MAG TPA: hypothetical protein VGL09_06560 [Methylomirabilota bacterium]|jgi:hypothetical protein